MLLINLYVDNLPADKSATVVRAIGSLALLINRLPHTYKLDNSTLSATRNFPHSLDLISLSISRSCVNNCELNNIHACTWNARIVRRCSSRVIYLCNHNHNHLAHSYAHSNIARIPFSLIRRHYTPNRGYCKLVLSCGGGENGANLQFKLFVNKSPRLCAIKWNIGFGTAQIINSKLQWGWAGVPPDNGHKMSQPDNQPPAI